MSELWLKAKARDMKFVPHSPSQPAKIQCIFAERRGNEMSELWSKAKARDMEFAPTTE